MLCPAYNLHEHEAYKVSLIRIHNILMLFSLTEVSPRKHFRRLTAFGTTWPLRKASNWLCKNSEAFNIELWFGPVKVFAGFDLIYGQSDKTNLAP